MQMRVLSTCCSAAVGVQCDSVDCSRSRAALRRVWVYSARRCSTAGCTWPVFAVLQCCSAAGSASTRPPTGALLLLLGRCKNKHHSGWSQSSADYAQHRGRGGTVTQRAAGRGRILFSCVNIDPFSCMRYDLLYYLLTCQQNTLYYGSHLQKKWPLCWFWQKYDIFC